MTASSQCKCGKPFVKGQQIWMKGRLRFCSLNCLSQDGTVEEAKAFVGLDGQEMTMIINALLAMADDCRDELGSAMHKALAAKFERAKFKFHEDAQKVFQQRHPELRGKSSDG